MRKMVFLIVMLVCVACNWNGIGKQGEVISTGNIVAEREFTDYTNEENVDKLFEKLREERKNMSDEPSYDNFRQDYWNFSNEIFKQLMQGENLNLVFSPLSAYIPLSELSYAMEEGSVKDELIQLLRRNSATTYWTKMLMDNFNALGYLVGSSIWIDQRCQPDIEFLKENLNSDIYKTDFADKSAAAQQASWINKWTNGFLKEQVKTDDFKDRTNKKTEIACQLIGTCYIKDVWQEEYFSDPKEGTFYTENGKEVEIPFLHSRTISTGYIEQENFEMVEIPMRKGKFVVILPKQGHTVQELLTQNILVRAKQENEWQAADVEIIMPDFVQSNRLELLPILNKLGYHAISQYQDGYEKLVGKNKDGSAKECSISQILQETKIEVKKAGIEAASYTKVDIDVKSALIEERKKVEMVVNRPYLYMVIGSHDLPSFIGVNQDF